MPHYGVDYGAPTGTPVQVTANGTVTFAGRKGGGGNMVTVRHANGYETNYLHLSGFARGIRRGVRVAQGQVLGYVGSTGLSTGPHLDYRVRLNGSWVNPLTISSPPVEPLAEGRLQRYLAHALAVLSLIEGREPPVGARC
jgi:murein DD-endopeptidase MepM/ murein hydrolase activator NlpD